VTLNNVIVSASVRTGAWAQSHRSPSATSRRRDDAVPSRSVTGSRIRDTSTAASR
jgi:hypothetical protein